MAQQVRLKEQRRRVRAMKDEEIGVELTELREKLFTLRSQQVTEKIEDSSQFGRIRHQVARLLTEQRRRRLEASSGGAA